MPRSDLLSLSADDLAALTNRGTLKRAQRELSSGDLTCEIHEDDQELTITWSDGGVCVFPADLSIHDAECSTGVPGISRHIIRSVLAYQDHVQSNHQTSGSPHAEAPVDPAANFSGWNPGDITDDDLERHFRKAAVNRARTLFRKGVVVELTRGTKPVARFLHDSCTIRFPVPRDVRYANGDCSDKSLPQWVMLAVWSFRAFSNDKAAGLLSLQRQRFPTPNAELLKLDRLLEELATDGLAALSATWPQRGNRIAKQLRAAGLVWPAELVCDLLLQYEHYQSHNARFDPNEMVRSLGELTARVRAIRSQNESVPQPLIRGTESDRPTDIKRGRYVGVGMRMKQGRRYVTLSAYCQNVDSGAVVAIERTFNDPAVESNESPRSFNELALHSLTRGVSLGAVALSQIVLASGKRTPTDELIVPRGVAKVTVNPQSFQWEELKPPFAVENFHLLRQRMETLPPDWLRPLRRTENLHVVRVAGVDNAGFDQVFQQLKATVHDEQGETATLIHPWYSRGADGFHDFMSTLQNDGDTVKFVCGHIRTTAEGIVILPCSVVLEQQDSRLAINPWISNRRDPEESSVKGRSPVENHEPDSVASVFAEFQSSFQSLLSDTTVMGLRQCAPTSWENLATNADQLGFSRLADELHELANDLTARTNQLNWHPVAAARKLIDLSMKCRILD